MLAARARLTTAAKGGKVEQLQVAVPCGRIKQLPQMPQHSADGGSRVDLHRLSLRVSLQQHHPFPLLRHVSQAKGCEGPSQMHVGWNKGAHGATPEGNGHVQEAAGVKSSTPGRRPAEAEVQ